LSPKSTEWNAREGRWRARKQLWRSLGIKGELGRKNGLAYTIPKYMKDGQQGRKAPNGTSIFDPVLCERVYSLWCPPGGLVLDPFAGGSVRGLVASIKGLRYWGCELRPEQVEANVAQLSDATTGLHAPHWECGDSFEAIPNAPLADFVFSCPPYGDLEKYSDDPADLSNMPYEKFLDRYEEIVNRTCCRLCADSFACFVVSNFRDRRTGFLIDFVGDTVQAFEQAGLTFEDEFILVTPVGSGALRINQFWKSRKIIRVHQVVLVFLKGDYDRACTREHG
jgi:DNA modification methylase